MTNIKCHNCQAAMTIELWRSPTCAGVGGHRLTALEIQALTLFGRG